MSAREQKDTCTQEIFSRGCQTAILPFSLSHATREPDTATTTAHPHMSAAARCCLGASPSVPHGAAVSARRRTTSVRRSLSHQSSRDILLRLKSEGDSAKHLLTRRAATRRRLERGASAITSAQFSPSDEMRPPVPRGKKAAEAPAPADGFGVVITGATKGVGFAMAREFLMRGDRHGGGGNQPRGGEGRQGDRV